MNKSLFANANFRIWILNCRRWKIKQKIIPDATVLKENKWGKSLCDNDALWCQKKLTDSCYISKVFDCWKVPLPVEIAQN